MDVLDEWCLKGALSHVNVSVHDEALSRSEVPRVTGTSITVPS